MLNTNNITNRIQLMAFLNKEGNSYSNFILEKLTNMDRDLTATGPMQVHHIIPSHRGGPDLAWNYIKLTVEEHATAHQLLFVNYNHFKGGALNLQDLGASQMLRGQIVAGH